MAYAPELADGNKKEESVFETLKKKITSKPTPPRQLFDVVDDLSSLRDSLEIEAKKKLPGRTVGIKKANIKVLNEVLAKLTPMRGNDQSISSFDANDFYVQTLEPALQSNELACQTLTSSRTATFLTELLEVCGYKGELDPRLKVEAKVAKVAEEKAPEGNAAPGCLASVGTPAPVANYLTKVRTRLAPTRDEAEQNVIALIAKLNKEKAPKLLDRGFFRKPGRDNIKIANEAVLSAVRGTLSRLTVTDKPNSTEEVLAGLVKETQTQLEANKLACTGVFSSRTATALKDLLLAYGYNPKDAENKELETIFAARASLRFRLPAVAAEPAAAEPEKPGYSAQ